MVARQNQEGALTRKTYEARQAGMPFDQYHMLFLISGALRKWRHLILTTAKAAARSPSSMLRTKYAGSKACKHTESAALLNAIYLGYSIWNSKPQYMGIWTLKVCLVVACNAANV